MWIIVALWDVRGRGGQIVYLVQYMMTPYHGISHEICEALLRLHCSPGRNRESSPCVGRCLSMLD